MNFVAAYVVRTDRSFGTVGSDTYRYKWSSDFRNPTSERTGFFIKPKLSLDYNTKESAIFNPQLELHNDSGNALGISRRWLKIRVKNTGSAAAYNCKAKLAVTEGTSQVRPHDTKRLIWDDSSESVTISPKKDSELLHIAFTDSNFGLNQNQIFAMISDSQSERFPPKTAQNGLGMGKFTITITVTSENREYIVKRLYLEVDADRNLKLSFVD